jgi:hypothetical protein
MSWGLTRSAAIQRGLDRKGKRRIVAKHADSSKHSIWRSAKKMPQLKQIPKWSKCGIEGIRRFE